MDMQGIIKNYAELGTSGPRRDVLGVLEAGLLAIQPEGVMKRGFVMYKGEPYEKGSEEFFEDGRGLSPGGLRILGVDGKWEGNLKGYDSVSLLGIGKGSAKISKYVAGNLRARLKRGYVIDSVRQEEGDNERYGNVRFEVGDHPIPTFENQRNTNSFVANLKKTKGRELTLVVVCGGASAMFTIPTGGMMEAAELTESLIKSGADISEINTVRKHMDYVKGGGLVKQLYRDDRDIVAMLFSDVPTVEDPKSFIASGPTVPDKSTKADALAVLAKYNVQKGEMLPFEETPKEEKYFKNVHNLILLDNRVALDAMERKAREAGYRPAILSTGVMGEARNLAEKVVRRLYGGEEDMLLLGGETTVKVANKNGVGGRNREVVLGALEYMRDDTVVASVGSDGWDYMDYAGAIADKSTADEAARKSMKAYKYLEENTSQKFFDRVGGNILTGRLPSNVADLMVFARAKKN